MNIETRMFGVDRNGAACDEIRPILQVIDPLFEIDFNYDTETYSVYFNGGFFMSVPWEDFSRETVERIHDTYLQNYHGTVFDEMDKHNEAIKKAKEKQRDEMVHEMAKDLRKAVLKDF